MHLGPAPESRDPTVPRGHENSAPGTSQAPLDVRSSPIDVDEPASLRSPNDAPNRGSLEAVNTAAAAQGTTFEAFLAELGGLMQAD